MGDFRGVDRSDRRSIPGEFLKQWTAEMKALEERLRRELTCPHCGLLMATGVPCGPASPEGSGAVPSSS
jgi:hypothetical protein